MIIVEIAGHLGHDPEERFTATGKRVVNMRVATRVRQAGRDDTIWWRVSIWGDRFDRMLPYLKKGSSIIVIGEMGKPETYFAKDGSTQVSLNLTAEIVKFSPFGRLENSHTRSEEELQGTPRASQTSSTPPAMQEQFSTFGASSGEEESVHTGDDLPF